MSDRARVTGIGGVFMKSRDPVALAAWYRENLGFEIGAGGTHAIFAAGADGTDATGTRLKTVWSTFPADTDHFGAGPATSMVNYRVVDLAGLVARLRAAGGWVAERIDESGFGRFCWAEDPEGTRFELWEPPAAAPTAG